MAQTETVLPITYNALAIEQPGAPVSLRQKTINTLGSDEALVRVRYASINSMDPKLAKRNVFNIPAPYVLGFDFSGEIVQTGSDGSLKAGDQVFGFAPTGLGGGFAEYLVVKQQHVVAREGVPAPEASTYGVAYLTAYESLMIAGDIRRHKGKYIYIAGAAGGLGHFAVQIAKIAGLNVIGSAGKPASLDLLSRLKVDHIIDYSKQDVVREIMNLTGGRGVDLVYDSTYNQSSYAQSTAVVASGGEYIRLGTPAQMANFGLTDLTAVVEGRGATTIIGDLGRYSADPAFKAKLPAVIDGLKQAVVWYAEGVLKPVITQTVPFDAAALQQAFEDFLRGKNNVGKIVVQCYR